MQIGMSLCGIVLAVVSIIIWTKQLDAPDKQDWAAWRYVAKLGIGLNMLSVFLFAIHLGMLMTIGVMR